MDLKSTGISNEDLTVRVNDFVDRMIEYQHNPKIWDYFPVLFPISVGFVVYELWRRFNKGEISKNEFRFLIIKATLGPGDIAPITQTKTNCNQKVNDIQL